MRLPFLAILAAGILAADPAPPLVHPLFADHAVLQRDRPLPVWGWDTPGAAVTATLGQVSVRAVADAQGRWQAVLPPQPAGGPVDLVVVGTRTETRRDLLLGDVWLCAGQSNMAFLLSKSTGGAEAAVDDPGLRLCSVGKQAAARPQPLPATLAWAASTPRSAAPFSAVAYHFGRDLRAALQVPIGLIQASWGGTVGEAWASRAAVLSVPRYQAGLPGEDGAVPAGDGRRYGVQGENRPTALYNGMIHPLVPAALRGVIWYQGESNGYPDQAADYRRLLTALIADWRGRFATPDLPFGIVQLAGWKERQTQPVDGGWAFIREAQALTARTVPGCGLALAIDLGDEADVHYADKAPVGHRLARWVRANVHGERALMWSGPWFRAMTVRPGALHLAFDHGDGLRSSDGGPLRGFAIAGGDRRWRFAEATVVADGIVLRSEQVPEPVAARYAWAMHPVCNLVNAAALPAVPFRTDDWN